MKRTALIVLTLALSTTSLTGCRAIRERMARRAAEKALSGATGGDVKISGSSGGGTVTVNDGTSGGTVTAGAGAKLPDGWPSNIPQYPGSTISASMSTPQGKTAVLQTTDTAAQVHDFYKSKLSGMKQQADLDMNNTKMLNFKDGAKTVSVTVATQAGKTQISISVTGG